MIVWKPTAAECALIRSAAEKEAGCKVKIEAGTRYNTNVRDGRDEMNIALVSTRKDWEDTDLFDYRDWATFKRGVELTNDGRAIVDFYLYSLGKDGELESNLTVYFENGSIVKLEGNGSRTYPAK